MHAPLESFTSRSDVNVNGMEYMWHGHPYGRERRTWLPPLAKWGMWGGISGGH